MTDAPDNSWQLQAACRGKWEWFDSVEDENGKDTYPFLEQAKSLCRTCPVASECALASDGEVTDIWSGEIKTGGKK